MESIGPKVFVKSVEPDLKKSVDILRCGHGGPDSLVPLLGVRVPYANGLVKEDDAGIAVP